MEAPADYVARRKQSEIVKLFGTIEFDNRREY